MHESVTVDTFHAQVHTIFMHACIVTAHTFSNAPVPAAGPSQAARPNAKHYGLPAALAAMGHAQAMVFVRAVEFRLFRADRLGRESRGLAASSCWTTSRPVECFEQMQASSFRPAELFSIRSSPVHDQST